MKLFFKLSTIFLICIMTVSQKPTEIEYKYDEEVIQDPEGQFNLFGVERIFKNPTILSGLSHSAESINRSIDSLMEALFYSILDNEIYFDVTDKSQFSWQLHRDLFSSGNSYVVVDRFSLGPSRGSIPRWRNRGKPDLRASRSLILDVQVAC